MVSLYIIRSELRLKQHDCPGSIKTQDGFETRGNRDNPVCPAANSWRATNNVMTVNVDAVVLLLARKQD